MRIGTIALSILLLAACGGGGGNNNPQGYANGPCYSNGRCSEGFTCSANICVPDIGLDAAASDSRVADSGLTVIDAPSDAPGAAVCNVLSQTGCASGEKCAWIEDSITPEVLGHIGCAPNGSAVTGAACLYGAPGATGYDNCVKGDVCQSGVCKAICDQNGGSPVCGSGFKCGIYDGLFGPPGQAVAAGVCDPTCDPFTDNDFDGSGGSAKTGSNCSAVQGCYGYPDTTIATTWSCSGAGTSTFVHRSACTGTCANSAGNPYLNGCAPGYLPLLYDSEGSMQVDCIAICQPANCSPGSGNCSNATIAGVSPYICKAGVYLRSATGTFNTATAGSGGNDGEHCIYSWFFEEGTNGLTLSPTSDTVGFCMDHSQYKYDPTRGSDYSTVWPKCDDGTALTAGSGFGSGSTFGAADFGCVDSHTAGLSFGGKAPEPVVLDRPRLPYRRVAR